MAHILYNTAYAPSVQFINAEDFTLIQRTGFEDAPLAERVPCRETGMEALLEAVCRHEELERLVIVVPTARRVRLLQSEIIRMMHRIHGKPTRQPLIFTFQSFVKHVFKNVCAAKKRRIVSEGYRLALFEEAVEKADLQFFARDGRSLSPATLERLAHLVWGLKKDGIVPQSLRDDVRMAEAGAVEGEYDVPRLRDIASLFQSYEDILGETFLDDWALLKITHEIVAGERDCETLERLTHADNSHAAKCGRLRKVFPKADLVFMEGFSEFREPELNFLSLFTNCEIPVAIRVDYGESGPLFGNMHKTVDKLRGLGFGDCYLDEEKPYRDSLEDSRITIPLGAYLRRWLFNTERDIRHPGFSNIGQIIAAENRLEEVRTIAKLIRNLSVNHQIPLSEMCVVMRADDRYTDLFREMFAAYTIPSNITDRFQLAKSPVTIAVFAVLDIILRGYRRDDVHRALQSPYLQFFKTGANGEKIPLNGANLYDVALRLRISGGERKGGKDAWIRRFEKSLESLERWVIALKSDEFADEFELERAQREFEQTALAYEDFKALCAMLPEKERKYSPAEFTGVIKQGIIKNLAVRESIVAFHDHVLKNSSRIPVEFVRFQEEVEKDARAYSALAKLLDEMTFIYTERGGKQLLGLDEFSQRFKTAVMAARYQVREKNGLGVTVTTIEQTRGVPFKVMILCGAVDGEFPGRYVPESFLGKELPESEERFIENERLQFYQFLTNNVKALEEGKVKLFITYPKHSASGDELVRSPFIDALLKVTSLHFDECCYDGHELIQRHGKSSAEFSLKEKSAVEWLTSIGSEDEVLKIIGSAYQSAQAQKKQLSILENIESIIETYELAEPAQYVRSMVSRYGDTPVVTGQILLKELTGAAVKRLSGFKDHSFSISELETYAKCGYKFFSHRLLNLKEKAGEDSQTLSAIERGTLFHTVLFKFYRKLQDEQIKTGETKIIAKAKVAGMPPLAPVKLDFLKKEEYSQLLKEIAKEELARISYEHPFFTMEQEELLGTPEKKGQLDIWLDGELNKLHSEKPWQFVPVLFETAFGMGDSVEPVKVGDIRLCGKIDRIEILQDGDGWKFLIADYKSSAGAVPTIGDLKNGQAFQVPLYLAAAQDFLEKCYGIEATPAGGAYYIFNPRFNKTTKKYDSAKPYLVPKSLKDTIGARGHGSWLENEAALYTSIESVGASAEAIAFKMTEGEYFAEPSHEKHCAQCSYSSVCRIREVNVRDNDTERTEEET